ncbi:MULTISPECIES: hypothetical protein [unclassified Achromobacter]|jgi:hypothetical protein|uniref:hypothetical protein n=1 Tax=unclassified Achromobacter TaxID=2626865 RepID=UPI0011788254|nr:MULTISPECIES: hypothetical protein [unclassified Achromobacter]
MTEEVISKEAFDLLLAQTGLPRLDARQTEDLRSAYKFVEAMKMRVRTPRGFDAEPALTFALPIPGDAK